MQKSQAERDFYKSMYKKRINVESIESKQVTEIKQNHSTYKHKDKQMEGALLLGFKDPKAILGTVETSNRPRF